jgi:putative FmdB family regulatory protein
MPTYEYSCPNGHEFEHFFRKISDGQPELPCPECGAIATRKVSGGAGLVFKGSGFYLTDYGKSTHNRKEEGKSTAGEKPEPPGETKASPAADAKSGTAAGKPAESSADQRPDSKKPKRKD